MDIQMPQMDGVEATRIIRNQLNIKTPIIALTANAFKHDIDNYMSIGMNDYVIKPYDENDLHTKLSLYLDNPLQSIINQKINTDQPN
jgi:CheY-like chemotaxis protein